MWSRRDPVHRSGKGSRLAGFACVLTYLPDFGGWRAQNNAAISGLRPAGARPPGRTRTGGGGPSGRAPLIPAPRAACRAVQPGSVRRSVGIVNSGERSRCRGSGFAVAGVIGRRGDVVASPLVRITWATLARS